MQTKEEKAAYSKAYYISHKDKWKCDPWQSTIGHTLGLTKEDYNNLFAKCRGYCEICGIHQSELKVALSIDHCHKTNKIRGLLCGNCNRGIGMFKDDASKLQRAIQYLKLKAE